MIINDHLYVFFLPLSRKDQSYFFVLQENRPICDLDFETLLPIIDKKTCDFFHFRLFICLIFCICFMDENIPLIGLHAAAFFYYIGLKEKKFSLYMA